MIDEKPKLSFPRQHFCSAPDMSEVSFVTVSSLTMQIRFTASILIMVNVVL